MFRSQNKKNKLSERRRPDTFHAAPQVYSYRSRRNVQAGDATRRTAANEIGGAQKLQRRAGWFATNRLGFIIAALLIIVALANILRLSSNAKIVVLASGAGKEFLQNTAVYQQAASKLFAGSALDSNKITADVSGISTRLKQEFPELASVSITLPLMSHRPIVYIAPSRPLLILSATDGQSYIIDENGRAAMAATKLPTGVNLQLPLVHDKSGLAVRIGSVALPQDQADFIADVSAQLAAEHVMVASFTLPPAASELDAQPNGEPYIVKFNMHSSATARQQVGTYLAVAQQLQQSHVTPSSYIDVRISGRAYYK